MADEPRRRVGAIFLPDLFCELALEGQDPKLPFAVVDCANEARPGEEAELGNVLTAANDVARRFGVRAGQTVVEARSLVASLSIRGLTRAAIRKALGCVAEVALAFGTTASIDPCHASIPLDTVFIDLTGTTHLRGGEEATLLELGARVRALGHRVRAAIADGPSLARAIAAFGPSADTIVPPGGGADAMKDLPIEALPLSRDHVVWLHRLGLLSVGDVVELPHKSLAGRLGERWRETLALALGQDDAPLAAYEPPLAPTEDIEWDEGLSSIEPLLFAVSGLASRLSARLEGRGEAARALELFAPYDRSIAKLRNVAQGDEHPGVFFRIELPTPLAHKNEIYRVFKSKLERIALAAPVLGMSITAALLTESPKTQLLLSGDPAIDSDPRSMAVLLAELSAEIGPDNVGVLDVALVHRPEARTLLVPLSDVSPSRKRTPPVRTPSDVEFPTRILAQPVPVEPMPGGRDVSIQNELFTIRSTRPMMRLDQVEWWTESPVCRDYARVWLTAGKKNVEGWIFTDRLTGKTFLHGYYD